MLGISKKKKQYNEEKVEIIIGQWAPLPPVDVGKGYSSNIPSTITLTIA